jgi:UTP--glucose-1-phosphate uridylyltransferase
MAEKGCLAQMVEQYEKLGGNMVAVMDVPRADTSKYGVLDISEDKGSIVGIRGLVEKPAPEKAPSTLSIIGRYILQPEVFDHLAAFERGAGGEFQLTDAMARLIGRQPFHGLRFEGVRYDCGSRLGFLEANIAFALADKAIAGEAEKILRRFGENSFAAPQTKTA